MHKSSYIRMKWFVHTYLNDPRKQYSVLDVGSYDVNGSYRELFPASRFEYIGLDMAAGPNVDIVPRQVYVWDEIPDNAYDVIVSGQAFEHIEFFWWTFAEIVRVLKPGGLLCLIAPRTCRRHRHPVDCWRIDEDGMVALAKYGRLEPLHVSMNLAPKNSDLPWYNEKMGDAMLVASKPQNWSGMLLRE